MASVSINPQGQARILFNDAAGNRKTLYLGKLNKKTAESIARHVEQLVNAKITGQPVPRETATWLTNIGDTLKGKLANVGLIEAQQSKRLSELVETYLSREDIKESTKTIRQAWANQLKKLLQDRPLTQYGLADAGRLRDGLIQQGLASPTVARILRFARQLFSLAVKHGWLTSNPFDSLAHNFREGIGKPRDYAEAEDVDRLIEASPPAWQMLIALARYAGLRCPSEAMLLRWEDVDLPGRRLTVTSPKTESKGKGWRAVPITPKLFPLLEVAWQNSEGQEYVVDLPQYRQSSGNWVNCNTRTQLSRLMKRAGVPSWERPFRVFRSSCVTDWAKVHPIHAVAAFAGHTVPVAGKHYLTVTDRDFLEATGFETASEKATQNTTQQITAMDSKQQQLAENQNSESLEIAANGGNDRQSEAKRSYPAWIRTMTKRTKISCATVTLPGTNYP